MASFGSGIDLDSYIPDEGPKSDEVHVTLPTSKVKGNEQARKTFINIKELSDSILEHGQIEDIVVTPADENGLHTIIAGERRWRACKLANIDVNCKIRNGDDKINAIVQLIENIQREDLTYIEIGRHLDLIQKENKFSINELSKAIKKNVSYVSRHLKVVSAGDEFIALCNEAGIKSIDLADNLEKIYCLNQKVAKRLVKKGITRDGLRLNLKKLKAGINTRVSNKKAVDEEGKTLTSPLSDGEGKRPLISFLGVDGQLTPITIVSDAEKNGCVLVKDESNKLLEVSFDSLRVVGIKK